VSFTSLDLEKAEMLPPGQWLWQKGQKKEKQPGIKYPDLFKRHVKSLIH
jgi:hypothetical protein